MLNIVRDLKFNVDVLKMFPCESKVRTSTCSVYFIYKVTSTSSLMTLNCTQAAIRSVAFVAEVVAKVVPQVVCIIHGSGFGLEHVQCILKVDITCEE